MGLVTSNFYSVLYYNSDSWHLPSLKPALKQKLLGASAKALKTCVSRFNMNMSFENIHILCERATPEQIMKYKMALSLFKLYNTDYNSLEFTLQNFNQVFTSRQMTFKTLKSNRTKIGLNSLANRLHHINSKVPFEWLNNSFETFKIKCKKLYL